MALPKEPRQKMINLMYLVLTALLALNVSAEILNAFKTVDNSLRTASETIDQRNDAIFKSFEEKLKDDKTRERAAIWKPKADQAKQLSDNIYTYIDQLKGELKKQAGLEVVDGVEKYKEDDQDAPTRFLVEGPKGKELHTKLTDYRNALLNLDPSAKAEFEKILPVDITVPKTLNEGNNTWEAVYFRMSPAVAAITILSKFQNDIRNSEAMLVDYFHSKVGEVSIVYDEFQAFAGTNSQYLMPGQELTITAGVGAFSKAARPTVTVDGAVMSLNAQGVAEYKAAVGGPGSYTKRVKISFVKPDGTPGVVEKDVQYTVGSPTGASVSADAVKVLYIGLDNPLTISGGTKGAEAVSASISQGSLQNLGGGKYMARVSTPGKTTINVTVDGKTTPFEFRVKSVPDPIAMVGASKGGRMRVNDFKAQAGVRAELENFVFEGVKFTVGGFTMVFTGNGFPELAFRQVGGYSFGNVRDLIERCRPGSTVTIDEIRASGPGGTRTLPPIVYNLY